MEILIFAFVVGAVYFKIKHPEYSWACMYGLHDYGYSHEKHGMHMGKDHNVVGTRRRVYTCRCGKEKSANKKDWL